MEEQGHDKKKEIHLATGEAEGGQSRHLQKRMDGKDPIKSGRKGRPEGKIKKKKRPARPVRITKKK